jgi:hypothetical protein
MDGATRQIVAKNACDRRKPHNFAELDQVLFLFLEIHRAQCFLPFDEQIECGAVRVLVAQREGLPEILADRSVLAGLHVAAIAGTIVSIERQETEEFVRSSEPSRVPAAFRKIQ